MKIDRPDQKCPCCERLLLPERIASKIKVAETIRPGMETACWEWIGCMHKSSGYGAVGWGGRRGKLATFHRLMYSLLVGPIPHGKLIRHKCDNRVCGNPDHLTPGTHLDNSRDMVSRGRSRLGIRNPRAVLTEDQVAAIRKRYAGGGISQRAVGLQFGVDQGRVSRIVRGKVWR